jgi:hypothetical protein
LKQSLKIKQTHKIYGYPRDKLYSIKHHVDYRNNQSGRLCVFLLLVDPSWKQFVVHVQKKTKGLLLKNIVGTVKKSYAQNALKGICGGCVVGGVIWS